MQAKINECNFVFTALQEDVRNKKIKLVKFSESLN